MSGNLPGKVLLTGGAPGGGVESYARALACGFNSLGVEAEVIAPSIIHRRLGEVRDPRVLKFLSTTAAFAVPFAKRAFVIAHGFPCVRNQGWLRTVLILASLKLANSVRGAQLLVVSGYSALHLESIFNLRVDGVVRNPLHPSFYEAPEHSLRTAITFVGRLHRSKNVEQLLPAMERVLDQHPELSAWVIGDGPERNCLEKRFAVNPRIRFWGALPREEVRGKLAQSRVFLSGNPTEPFGIVFLEALSQGCTVVMPASGGGLEIAPDEVGRSIQLFDYPMNEKVIQAAIERALAVVPRPVDLNAYSPVKVAKKYLRLDARFNESGEYAMPARMAEARS